MKIEKETLKEKWLIFLVLGVMLLAYAYKGGYLGTTFGQFHIPTQKHLGSCNADKTIVHVNLQAKIVKVWDLYGGCNPITWGGCPIFGVSKYLCGIPTCGGWNFNDYHIKNFKATIGNYDVTEYFNLEAKTIYSEFAKTTSSSFKITANCNGLRNYLLSVGYSDNSRDVYITFSFDMVKTVDSDKDGIPDDEDLCPNEPGIPQLNGCPAECMTDEDCPDIPIENGMKIGSCVNYECEYTIVCDEGYELKDGECVKISPFTGLITFLKTNPIIIGLIALVIIGIIFYRFRGE